MKVLFIAVTVLLIIASTGGQLRSQSLDSANTQKIGEQGPRLFVFNSDSGLRTEVLLRALNWDSLASACSATRRNNDGCIASIRRDSLITYYRYGRRSYQIDINITDYRGIVLSYEISASNNLRPLTGKYFDKPAWISYAREKLGPAADSVHISENEPEEIIRAYYQLLGMDTDNEYGWLCEYNTMGIAPAQRLATITLVAAGRSDLLRRILRGPNLTGQVYAADALIYLDYYTRPEFEKYLQQRTRSIEEMESYPRTREQEKRWMKSLNDTQDYIKRRLLSEEDQDIIDELRSSDAVLNTCGLAGSYKIYPVPVSEVLSDSEIAQIPENYQNLKNLGYFQFIMP